jgi:AraC family transcriptional regulator of adaptative response / DNA-3-methyladenine glycosylase II
VFFVEPAADAAGETRFDRNTCLTVEVSSSLLPVLMPLLARIRQMFDLDAEPTLVDGWLESGGLEALVRRHPGLRIPGTLDGFDAAFRVLLHAGLDSAAVASEVAGRVTTALGQRLETGFASLTHLGPTAQAVAGTGCDRLVDHGVPLRAARALTAVATAMAGGSLRLDAGCDVAATRRALVSIEGIGDTLAARVIIRALSWPDAFPGSDPALLRSTGVSDPSELRRRADRWRPWRTYAALHLWLDNEPGMPAPAGGNGRLSADSADDW